MVAQQAQREAVIDLRNITKTYKVGKVDVLALRGVSLRIYRGEFVSIMGPSGSGKSTLLHVLGALERPTSGDYYLDRVNVADFSKDELADVRNHKIGFVFQNFNLLKRTTATQQVVLPLIYGKVRDRIRQARSALEAVGLQKRLNHLPGELSGGQQQRVAVARAVVGKPSIILADEPTGNLDSQTGMEVLKLLQEMNRINGMTIVIVTHDPFIARQTDRVIVLRDGLVVTERASEISPFDGGVEGPSFVKRQELDE